MSEYRTDRRAVVAREAFYGQQPALDQEIKDQLGPNGATLAEYMRVVDDMSPRELLDLVGDANEEPEEYDPHFTAEAEAWQEFRAGERGCRASEAKLDALIELLRSQG
jgi:hypothetical protein